MDTVPGLKPLQSRKRDLLLESELNRQALRLEIARLRLRGEQLRNGIATGQVWWKLAAPIAGFFIARRVSKGSGLVAKGSLLVSLLGTAWKFWSGRKPADAREMPEG
jgi:hypothetical protein